MEKQGWLRVLTRDALNTVEDDVVGVLLGLSSLDLGGDTNELLLEGILGGSGQHLVLDTGSIRSPDEEEDLLAHAISLLAVFKIEHTISALVLRKLGGEVIVGGGRSSGLLDFESSLVSVELDDNVSEFVAELNVVESVNDFRSNFNSGGHGCREKECREKAGELLLYPWLILIEIRDFQPIIRDSRHLVRFGMHNKFYVLQVYRYIIQCRLFHW